MKPDYLCPTSFFDYEHPAVTAFADRILQSEELTDIETAIKLYYAVRDEISYNPYSFSLDPTTISASYCLEAGDSYCIPKAILLGALARYKGIPSRLGLADVRNHLSSKKLTDYLKSDIFVMHGFVELYLNGNWIKATPAFDSRLCKKIAVTPLEFDGKTDSIFQEFNHAGHKAMEYLVDHGTFDDVPTDFIFESLREAYPHLLTEEALKDFHKHNLFSDIEHE